MKNSRIIGIVSFLLIVFGQQGYTQEDAVFLYDGREISGLIVEEVPFSHLRIQTNDYGIRTYAFEDVSWVFRPKGIKGYWDVVYLKSGGVMRGFIADYEWGKFLRIEDERGNDFEWRMEDIRKINKEPTPNDATLRKSAERQQQTRKELRNENQAGIRYGATVVFFEAGGQLGASESSIPYPGIFANFLIVYRLEDRFSLGAGVGADILYNVNGNPNTGRTAFGDMRIYFPRNKVTPYLSIASGYDWYRSGIMFNPGTGVKMNFLRNHKINLNIGLKMQYESNETRNSPDLLGVIEVIQFKLVID
ncbi:MAG: hypothetical protein SF052_18525 [Bacteroidia bacterium]|nr:hypothetical protein [Bacteroidia bacterium]